NRLGGTLGLYPALAKYMRRSATDLSAYLYVHGWKQEHEFAPGLIFHLIEADNNQEIYGLPEFLSALHSAWLNEAATLI
ncbi:capsid portal protein, partial [Undibacterium sp. 10I3]|nr:capsid portal protein [Undibacterium sp. 10I3]